MSQPFSFPPPPPPPPRRDPAPSHSDPTTSFTHRAGGRVGRGRGAFQHDHGPRGRHQLSRGRGDGGSNGRHPYDGRGGRTHVQSSSIHVKQTPKHHQTTQQQKRPHIVAFGAQKTQSRPKAPPAVPSFDADIDKLLSKKSVSISSPPAKPVTKKNNLLGLIPNYHSDSDGISSDEDDETKLASIVPAGNSSITFSHAGQTLTLSTPAEINAWIEQRRARFPTQAKVDVARREAELKKQKWEEEKQQRFEAKQKAWEERQNEKKEREKVKLRGKLIEACVRNSRAIVNEKKNMKTGPEDAALAKAEKLRRRAEKAASDLKKAEDALQKARARIQTTSTNFHPSGGNDEDVDDKALTDADLVSVATDTTGVLSELDVDDTSSSGSSGSDTVSGSISGTDSAAESEAPEQSSTRRNGPERIAPPPRQHQEPRVCKNLIKFGHCRFGKKCRYSHDVPHKDDGKQKGKNKTGVGTASDHRKTLYQIMVEKEQEEEKMKVLKYIISLGEQGLLADSEVINATGASADVDTL